MKRSRPSRSHSKIVFAASIVFMEFSYISTNIPQLYRYFVQNIQLLRLDLVRISSFSGVILALRGTNTQGSQARFQENKLRSGIAQHCAMKRSDE